MTEDMPAEPEFLSGVVEGFYGQPWSQSQRFELFDHLAAWGLNTYFYAPKDDLKHRALWRELYTPAELADLAAIVEGCSTRGIRFIYGLSPGLDIRFSDARELETIHRRLTQLIEVGCGHFALLFDDLPGEMQTGDQETYDSIAAAQSDVTNRVFAWLRQQLPACRLLFCPTPYCDRMARAGHGGPRYLETIGQSLAAEIDILWTGPEIVSREIPVDSIRQLAERVGRPPVIWDNLHANDYDLRRLYCGPYTGRAAELRDHVRGIVSNPNNEFPINYIPLRTLAAYLTSGGDYEPRVQFERALAEWAAAYETVGGVVAAEDLKLLADCYYLPFEQGPEAVKLQQLVACLVRLPVAEWGDRHTEFLAYRRRVQETFDKLTQLKRRDLFYAWSRRVWELNEELQLIEGYLAARQAGADRSDGVLLDTHLPGTYRGGIVAELQRLLEMDESGKIRAADAG